MIVTIPTSHAHATYIAHYLFHDFNGRVGAVVAVATAATDSILASIVGFEICGGSTVDRDNMGVYTAQSIGHCNFHRRSRETGLRNRECPVGCPRVWAFRSTLRQHLWYRIDSIRRRQQNCCFNKETRENETLLNNYGCVELDQ